jgi:hypothetical protein
LLLFVILFYVYPLKFVFVASVETIVRRKNVITAEQAPTLFLVYGAGFAAVFLILGFMYRHAWKRRVPLQLNQVEGIDTLKASTTISPRRHSAFSPRSSASSFHGMSSDWRATCIF